MKPIVTFKALSLLSEREMSARRIPFSKGKNLLAGPNGTGKSRVIKHLFWALGAEPTKLSAGNFDTNVVAVLELQVGQRHFTFVRQNRRKAVFNQDGQLLLAAQDSTAWNAFFAQEFDFDLQLQQQQDEGAFSLAGPSFATLPFYIDQSTGWGAKWGNFWNLGQFVNWQSPLFEYFTGLKPAAYSRARVARDKAANKLRDAKLQQRLQAQAFHHVAAMLPSDTAVLDDGMFARELKDLSSKAEKLVQMQEQIRCELLELVQEREQKIAEMQMALRSEKDLVEDLAYLAGYKDTDILQCPTCGQEHGLSFKARLDMAEDAKDMHQLGLKVREDIEKLDAREVKLRDSLRTIASELRELDSSMKEGKDGRVVGDVVAAKSRETLERAYDATRRDLVAEIDSLSEEKGGFDAELAGLTDKSREKRIRGLYKSSLLSVADRLDIDKNELGGRLTIGTRPPSADGAYLPRAILATHIALLACHKEAGAGVTFPFVVDTPQQSGQDPVNLGRMLTVIFDTQPHAQSMVASESLPIGWGIPEDCNVIRFTEKRGLLLEEKFQEVMATIGPLVKVMNESLKDSVEEPVQVVESTESDDDEDELS